ncbi:hypothetical protein D3C75_1008390 [compost metagenome]
MHIGDDFVGGTYDLLRVLGRQTQRFAGKRFGLVQLPGIAEGDRQVATGQGLKVRVVIGLGQIQCFTGSPGAQAQLTALGQCHRLAAILITTELQWVLLIEHGALFRQAQHSVGIRKR